MLILANVFISAVIRGASTQLLTAMEHVAGKAEELTKAKIKNDPPPPPFRKCKTQSVSKFADWDPKEYATDGKASCDKRAEKRHIRVFGMQKLGMVEYRKLMEEVDQMTNEPVDVMALVNKWIEELRERFESEEKEKQEKERRQTQSKKGKAGTSSATKMTNEPIQEPRKRARVDDDIDESRSRTGTKKPKTSKSTEKKEGRKMTGAKKPKTDDAVDESENRQKERAQKKLPSPKAKATAQAKKVKETVMEDDDDWLEDLVIVERKVPEIEDYDDDDDRDEDYEPEEEVDDDFEIPPLRACKPTQSDKLTDKSKKAKQNDAALEDLADFVERTFPKTAGKKALKGKGSMKQRRVGKSRAAEDTDGTLPLFQQIVGDDYEVMASEEVEQHIMDRCINLVEAAGFRATMKTLSLGLKEAVKKGRNIDTTYEDLIKSTIEVAHAMRYPGAFSVEVEEILAAIPDIHCNAWRKHLKAKK